MATFLYLLLWTILLCASSVSCNGSTSSYHYNCTLRWNQNDIKENELYVFIFAGYLKNCSVSSVNGTSKHLGIPECECGSKSLSLLPFLNSTGIYQATITFQKAQWEDKGRKCTIKLNCTAVKNENSSRDCTDIYMIHENDSSPNHTSEVICVFSFESYTETSEINANLVLQVAVQYTPRLDEKGDSEEAIYMKIAALLILGLLFVLLLLVIVGLCSICRLLKITSRSSAYYNRILPKISMDEASIATYASVKCPSRKGKADYHEVNILPSVSEVDEIEVFDLDELEGGVGTDNDQDKMESKDNVIVDVDDNEVCELSKTKVVKKPSVIYAFIKKAKTT